MDPTTATPSGAEEVLISITIFTYTTQVYASVLARCSKLCKSILYSQVDEDGKPEDTDWIVVPLNEENDDYDGWLLLPACDESVRCHLPSFWSCSSASGTLMSNVVT